MLQHSSNAVLSAAAAATASSSATAATAAANTAAASSSSSGASNNCHNGNDDSCKPPDSHCDAHQHAISSFDNLGTVLSPAARNEFHLRGVLPPGVDTPALQEIRALEQLRARANPMDRFIFLSWLRNSNTNLFYRLLLNNLAELTPYIYTPHVGTACLEYSHIQPFLAPPGHADGLYISINDVDNIHQLVRDYREAMPDPSMEPQIAVITDGSRILGLGDLGVNGMGIPVGKLQLYIAAGGFDPRRTLPITVDFGTNNEKFLADPLYLGLRQRRPDDSTFFAAMEKVMSGLHSEFPKMFIQFEDFSSEHAFELLDIYRDKYSCFNDDIQGTGAVILSGFMRAIELAGLDDPLQHRILFFGAGSAGVGVGKQLMEYFIVEHGISEEKAKKMFWFVDTKGLITADRGDKLAQHKVFFARDDNNGTQCKTLEDALEYVKPTALIGLSTQYGVFTPEILRRMAALNDRPIVFPLSNPATAAECNFEDAMKYTNNKVIFASGTGFPPVTIPAHKADDGKDVPERVVVPGQGNNMYQFPGIGLGVVLANTAVVTDNMIYTASASLANSLTKDEIANGLLYPRIERIREVSAQVAAAVAQQAVREGLCRNPEIAKAAKIESATKNAKPDGAFTQEVLDIVTKAMWVPSSDSSPVHTPPRTHSPVGSHGHAHAHPSKI
ncbi:malic enzyme [Ramicandelaber brevisporus]|nr:malic enzyme [Ramicandelaber brevisporus]